MQRLSKLLRSPFFYARLAKASALSRLSPALRQALHAGRASNGKQCIVLALTILQWLGFEKDDAAKEDELIMTLKRAVLCIRKLEFDKAEQMLHLALRLAQQQQNAQGVMYCYDLMANLALDTQHLDKAEKIFIALMKLLLESGVQQDDNKMIHISLKLARINHLLAKREVAHVGFKWCLEKASAHKDRDADANLLYAVVKDWYAQFLLDEGDVAGATKQLREAHQICIAIGQQNTEQEMLLLNDLGTTYWKAGDPLTAEELFKRALLIGKQLKDQQFVGVVFANLGLIYLQNGMAKQAKENCTTGWHLGRMHSNAESIGQSTYCLDQIKEHMDEAKLKS